MNINKEIVEDNIFIDNGGTLTFEECEQCSTFDICPAPLMCNKCFKKMYKRNGFCDDKLEKRR